MAKLSEDNNKLISAIGSIADRYGCDLLNVNMENDYLDTIKLHIEVIPRNALSHHGIYRMSVAFDRYSLTSSAITIHNFVCMEVEKHLSGYFGKKRTGRNFVDQKYIEQNDVVKKFGQKDFVKGFDDKVLEKMLMDDKDLEDEMQKRIVRPKIVRQNPINTAKVKKPHCPIDKVEMHFDPAAQKFYCPEPTCHQVARPRRDSDDKQVVLGRGQLQVRFVIQPNKKPRVILISDDNVALDITSAIPPVVVGKFAKEFTETYIQGNVDRMERMITIPSRTLGGLEITEMLLMFEP